MKVINKRSSVVLNNQPKLPSVDQIEYGEIAINFADGYETISILNSNSGIVTFSADHIIESKVPSVSALSASVITIEETMGEAVVSGSFDSSYNIVLNKANNTDINIPISGMLDDYQRRIDAHNKLSADYIMDGQLNGYYTIDERKKLGKLITTVATSASSGYMKSEMVVKLDSVQSGAEVNQNAYSSVFIHDSNTSMSADSKTAQLEFESNNKDLIGFSIAQNRAAVELKVNFSAVTQNLPGLMLPQDKTKLDAIPNISASDSGKVLQVSSAGTWTLVVPNIIYVGVDMPSNQLGNNGDVYLQTS